MGVGVGALGRASNNHVGTTSSYMGSRSSRNPRRLILKATRASICSWVLPQTTSLACVPVASVPGAGNAPQQDVCRQFLTPLYTQPQGIPQSSSRVSSGETEKCAQRCGVCVAHHQPHASPPSFLVATSNAC